MSRRRRCEVTLKRRATSMIRTPIFDCVRSRCAAFGGGQARLRTESTSDRSRPRTDRPAPGERDRPGIAGRATWILIGLLLALLPGVSTRGFAAAPPLPESLAAWFEVRSWLDAGGPPASDRPEARISIPESDRVAVVLRLDGRTVGVGLSSDATTLALHEATETAISRLRRSRAPNASTDDRRRALARLQLEIEVAGVRRPLVGATLAAAASRLRFGLDGVAIRRRDRIALAFPGRMLATGTANAQSPRSSACFGNSDSPRISRSCDESIRSSSRPSSRSASDRRPPTTLPVNVDEAA